MPVSFHFKYMKKRRNSAPHPSFFVCWYMKKQAGNGPGLLS